MADDGVVLLAGRTVDTGERRFGLVVFTAPSLAAAQTRMRSDRAIAQGVMHCELFPYRVAVGSDAWKAKPRQGFLDAPNGLAPSAQDCALLSLLSHEIRL